MALTVDLTWLKFSELNDKAEEISLKHREQKEREIQKTV